MMPITIQQTNRKQTPTPQDRAAKVPPQGQNPEAGAELLHTSFLSR